ncbi:peptidoglycan DD-metalloendopeptidase family protein [Paraburkholderia sp. SIMBA_049]|nr:peptidoglycan DD-metalloendopeptidase family protein [Paraburkholderia hospita]OUL79467.1 peptidase M23 [Paraburkholderia hospita]OUL81360.1 peptidase M23 [Paraburkholderia hospita]OUL83300.1 peptidase M23 [Paraburkholderia hospita]
MQNPFIAARVGVLLTCLSLAACSGQPWGGIADPAAAIVRPVPVGFYRVAAGDTLSRIATGYGRPVQDIAEWNGLPANATVAPGQLLRVAPIKTASAIVVSGLQSGVDRTGSNNGTAMEKASLRPDGFTWPLNGPVLTRFVQGRHGNIEIGGKPGELVKAAAAGRVVYAGTGIHKYGALVIIKHDKNLITAYGHNSILLVKDGDAVAQGQPISEVGVSNAGMPSIQFEMRMNGKPVDPLSYLPAF